MFSCQSAIDVENLNSRPLGTLYSFGGWTVQDIHATTNSVNHEGPVGEHPVR